MQACPIAQRGCRDDLFGGRAVMIGHAGDAYGVRSGLWIDRRSGIGIAYYSPPAMATIRRAGASAYRAIEERLARRLRRSGR